MSTEAVPVERVLHPVTVGEDIISTIRIVSADIVKLVVEHDERQAVTVVGSGVPDKEDDVLEGLVELQKRKNLVSALGSLRGVLELAVSVGNKAGRDDLLELLEDPLSGETRNTRRNVGALSVLAILVAFAGKAPDSFLGFGISKFQGWEFPLLLALVLAFEFVAFSLYLRADLARRKIQRERVALFREELRKEFDRFVKYRDGLSEFLERERRSIDEAIERGGDRDIITKVLKLCLALTATWYLDIKAFDAEFGIETSRRRWDQHVPKALFAISFSSLVWTLRPYWPRVIVWLGF